jgi:phosphatidylethanolamine/phosphatidyl-N-methylethanolamine N-methyltransferase
MDNRQNKERRFWDRFANYYDSFINKVFRKSYASILENIEPDLNINHDVLEIGTGTGIIPFSICSKVSSIVATDISPKMVHIANQKLIKTKIQNIDFQIQDSYNLTLPDKSFDMVIASNLFHLLYEPEKPLNEVKRVLRICAGENTKSKIIASIIGTLSGFKVVNKWSINEFKNMLINNGFIITKTVIIYDKIPLAYIVMKNNIATKT